MRSVGRSGGDVKIADVKTAAIYDSNGAALGAGHDGLVVFDTDLVSAAKATHSIKRSLCATTTAALPWAT